MWSMPVVLTEMENDNDSVNQNYVAKIVALCTNTLISVVLAK